MGFENRIHLHEPRDILILPDLRQRGRGHIDDSGVLDGAQDTDTDNEHEKLITSIARRGLINPITVNPADPRYPGKIVLVAGERRLTAYLIMESRGTPFGEIPCRYTTELSASEAQVLELEENLLREDLTWIDQIQAVRTIHTIWGKEAEGKWSPKDTAERLGYGSNTIYKMIEVADAIHAGKTTLQGHTGWGSAYIALQNLRTRQKEAADASLKHQISSDFEDLESYKVSDVKAIIKEAEKKAEEPTQSVPPLIPSPFVNDDFISFADSYRGVPFNFIHFDPPYGIEIHDSDQANALEHGTYDDDPEVLWAILSAFTRNLDRLLSPMSHGILWYSPKMGEQIREFLSKEAPDIWVQDVPLVWLKSDNRGIVADVQRRPRNVTEFAFVLVRGDRKIIRSVANGYAAPTSRAIHQAEKPIPVLKHFFQMFLDETSRVLDPTSGSGNALVAADYFAVNKVLGIEKDKEYYERSVIAWKKYKSLKEASET